MASKKQKLIPVEIKESKWLHATPEELFLPDSALLLGNKMCCMGFLAKAHGYTRAEMKDIGFPSSIERKNSHKDRKPFPNELFDLENEIAKANDSYEHGQKARVKELFERAGYKAIFVK